MRLMVALDLNTEGHHWLLEQASRVATMCSGTLDLLYIDTQESDAATLKNFEKRLQEMAHLVDAGVRGETRVLQGALVESLTEISRTYEGMVVGPREPGALERLLMGTVATRVMRAAQCPVVIPRHVGEKAKANPRLLVGVDLTKDSHRWLINQAGEWAASLGGCVDAVFMVPNPAVAGIRNKSVRDAALREWAEAQAPHRKQLESAMASIDKAHRGKALVEAGDPENDLVALSADYDFVVVGNLEHSGLKGYLLGTVASHVVRSAKCHVITLPAAAYLQQREEN